MKRRGDFCTWVGDTEIKVSWTGYYDPGCASGPPERCYPPEGEVEFELFPALELSAKDRERIESECWEALQDGWLE